MMKRLLAFILIVLAVFGAAQAKVRASESGIPYPTFTLGEYGRLMRTKTAYIPVGHFGSELGLSSPEDIFHFKSNFYIADSGNGRVLEVDADGKLLREFKDSEFLRPTGVFVSDAHLFVADKEARIVFRLDMETGEILQRIERPTSPIFGKNTPFVPLKVAVGSNDNIYIVGEGSTSGIIQMNYAGEFVGYLGINTVEVSLRKKLYNWFVKDGSLASSRPSSPTNVALGTKGSILTTNNYIRERFKRLNIAGVNTLGEDTYYPPVDLADIWMSEEGFIFMVANTGEVYEYDSEGNLLFYFNTRDQALKQALGLTSQPSGIVTDSEGNLYILDKIYNNVQIYQRTVFVDLVHEAVNMYNNGRYLESKSLWEEILRQNSSFALAHSALGSALVKEGKYEEALSEFYDAKDYWGYSNAFWEIRNLAIQNQLTVWVLVFIAAFLAYKVLKRVFRLLPVHEKIGTGIANLKKKPLVSQLGLAFRIIRKPNDVIYRVKRKNEGSYVSGFIILFLYLVVNIINAYGTSFLFRYPFLRNAFTEFVAIIAIFFLFVFTNYLVSTFFDGEGSFKTVFIVSCYALVPTIILTPPLTLLSYVLTFNEAFLIELFRFVISTWTIILLIYSVKEVHNYSFRETVLSILLILFGIVIIIILGLLIYSFIGQLFDFLMSIIKEVIYRV